MNSYYKEKMFILLMSVLSLVLAEPPLGDSYLEAAEFSRDHTLDQQYPYQDFSVPSARNSKVPLNTTTNQYIGSKSGAISEEYGTPELRALSSEYGTPNARTTGPNFRHTISQEYGAPSDSTQGYDSSSSFGQSITSANLKSSLSPRYGAPNVRKTPSSVYGTPLQRSPSAQYGAPEFRSTPEEYNAPALKSNEFSYNRNSSPVQKYGVPRSFSQSRPDSSQGHNSLSRSSHEGRDGYSQFQTTRNTLPTIYGTPRSLSTRYGSPESRNTASYTQELPLSTSYAAPNGRNNAPKYEALEFQAPDLKTNAFPSSYPSTRASSHGAPSSHSKVPSQENGVPHHRDALSGQGYDYARSSQNPRDQEPASYEFAYKVSDYESGSDFGHTENREEGRAEGTYFVSLPDGTKQIVEYEADEDGFKPRISVEPADSATALSAGGPY